MKHYINTEDNTLWAFEDDVNPSDFPSTPSTLQLIQQERPSNEHHYENGQWDIPPAPTPEPVVELTAAEKLAQAGLSVDELKQLLGL